MEVELWFIDRPVPYARNARKIPPAAVDKVAASIKEFGWRQPIVVDSEAVIIAGHTRLLAAQKLGLKQVPVHVATGLSPAQVKAYRLMDNRTHEEAAWDMDLLPLELVDLKALSFDLELTGFDDQELGRLLSFEGTGLTDENAVPEAPEKPQSKLGDVWLLGNHRLVCGDCTDPAVVGSCLGQVKPQLMVTDPPYGVQYDPPGAMMPAALTSSGEAPWPTTSAVIGRKLGHYFPAPSSIAGTPASMPRSCRRVWSVVASRSARKSSGPRTASPYPAAITTGNTNLEGMR